jgi:acetyltransferase-like isoleucine patch superfamily enzyme
MNLIYIWSKFLKKLRGSAIINSTIPKTSKVESGSHIVNTTFGKHSFCGYDCEIINCEVGSFCSIANNVKIGGGVHPMNWVSMSPVFYEGRDSVKAKFSEHRRNPSLRTIIGHDVWIGQSAIVKQGVTIGTGAVIGMGSIVTKNVEPYSIVAGCPAKELKRRFDNNIIVHLLESNWWNLNEKELFHYAQFFTEPEKFLSEFKK